jgi:hypothetical protein
MPEDRFDDLGSGERRSAAERFEEEDRLHPEPDMAPKRPEVPRAHNKYAWVVGIVMVMGIGVLLMTTALPNTGAGLRGPAKGEVVPDFAAALATGDVSCDDDEDSCAANVCQSADECSEQSGSQPACQLRSESIFNVCEARERPMVLTFLVTEGADCEPQVDRVERMRSEFPGVSFAAVVSGEGRGEVERIARRRGWGMPVAVDPDGALQNLYGLGVCPSTVFAYEGGKVRTTELGNLTEDQLRAQVRRIVRSG